MQGKTHILVISQYFYPEQFRINDITTELVKRGYKVTVITGIPNYPQGKFFDGYGYFKKRKANYNGAEIIRIPIIPRGHSSVMMALNYLSFVASGYRTQEKQQSLYDEKIQEYRAQGYSAEEAVRQAQRWVAVPGTSEHQLGIAVDINGAVWEVYPWLQANSYKYGFIFRYPGEKTSLTGTAEEVWHYRYVGVEAAAQIYERGLCLEEYLETL